MENDFTLVGSYAEVIGSHTIIKVGIQGRLLPFSFSFRHKQTGMSVYNLFQTGLENLIIIWGDWLANTLAIKT